MQIIDDFADCIRREWNAVGLKKGYMYMADCVTDPRWQRTFGTFGEEPELIAKIFEHLIPGIQGSEQGVTPDGVSMTVKHFPGGGARENGFDPQYALQVVSDKADWEKAAKVHRQSVVLLKNDNVLPLTADKLAGKKVYAGCFSPVGKLPITLPKGDEVLAVNVDGICISPNDVPRYDKDRYMPDSLKDENGKAYAYRDAAGNYYELGFGLKYE